MFIMGEWIEPEFSKGQIRKAGKYLAGESIDKDSEEYIDSIDILNNWRSAHSRPLQTFLVSLRKKASAYDDALVARRLKRRPSIIGKLKRYPNMKLESMQDLGGCRAILRNVQNVRAVESAFLHSRHRHILKRHDDYIRSPKQSGYRGIHMVYDYQSDINDKWNGLRVEIQIRTELQHFWATAVETVGLFTGENLKSSIGKAEWLEFFKLMSCEIACTEQTPMVPGFDFSRAEIRDRLKALNEDINVVEKLNSYNASANYVNQQHEGKGYALIILNANSRQITVQSFRLSEVDDALGLYAQEEERYSDDMSVDVALVGLDKMRNLPKTYPNYYLNMHKFVSIVKKAVA